MNLEDIAAAAMCLPLGRSCTLPGLALRMAQLVLEAGDGDHLEIGVLHGSTLILAALVKEEYGLKGDVVGIDPLAGYYPAGPANPNGVYNDKGLVTQPDDGGVPVTMGILQYNIDTFGVGHRIRMVQDFSYPWPETLKDARFVSAYIDGDHFRDGPLHDWESTHPRTDKLIWFDDCTKVCPAVLKLRSTAASTPGWRERELHGKRLLVLERVWEP